MKDLKSVCDMSRDMVAFVCGAVDASFPTIGEEVVAGYRDILNSPYGCTEQPRRPFADAADACEENRAFSEAACEREAGVQITSLQFNTMIWRAVSTDQYYAETQQECSEIKKSADMTARVIIGFMLAATGAFLFAPELAEKIFPW